MLNIHMAGVAENQRFAAARGHDLNPERLLSTVVLFQVFECPNVVDLYFVRHASCPALFTHLSK